MGGLSPGPWQGHYQILRPLGRGGMGEVWLAHDARLQRRVVVKIVRRELEDDSAHRRFVREIRSVAELNHPNIARLYDAGVDDDETAYFTMEFVEGVALSKLVLAAQERGGLDLPALISVGRQACDALSALHRPPESSGRAPLVHRDVSPQNLMLTGDGVLKLLDLGIARSDGLTALTRAGTMIGKPAYMSPEQGRGMAVGPTADLYALGVVLFEVATGRWLRSRLPRQALAQITDAAFTARRLEVADLTDGLRELLSWTLAFDPSSRPQSAEQVARALEALAPEVTPGAAERDLVATLDATMPEAFEAVQAQRAEDLEALVTAVPTEAPPAEAARPMVPVGLAPALSEPAMPTPLEAEPAPPPRAGGRWDPRPWFALAAAAAAVALYAWSMQPRVADPEVVRFEPAAAPSAAPIAAPRRAEPAKAEPGPPPPEPAGARRAAPARATGPAREARKEKGASARPGREQRARPADREDAAEAFPAPGAAGNAEIDDLARAEQALKAKQFGGALRWLKAYAKTLEPARRRAVLVCIEDATFLSVERPRLEPCIARAKGKQK